MDERMKCMEELFKQKECVNGIQKAQERREETEEESI